MKLTYYQSRDHWRTVAWERLVFGFLWSVNKLTRPIPLWWLGGALAWPAGRVAMLIPGVRRRALRNLERVWPEMPTGERRLIARRAAEQFTRLAVEYAHLGRFGDVMDVKATGTEHLAAARDAGKGAVLVTAHFGNWEAARLIAQREGCETGIIFRKFNNRFLTRYSVELIGKYGQPVLLKGRRGMRQLVQHVARGGFIMILVDQRNSGAPFLDFLGHPAETVTAAADLAHRTGAALIPVRATRNVAARRFEVSFEAPITGDDPTRMMQDVNDRIGAWITEQPEQWLWFHRRWRQTIRSRAEDDEPGA